MSKFWVLSRSRSCDDDVLHGFRVSDAEVMLIYHHVRPEHVCPYHYCSYVGSCRYGFNPSLPVFEAIRFSTTLSWVRLTPPDSPSEPKDHLWPRVEIR